MEIFMLVNACVAQNIYDQCREETCKTAGLDEYHNLFKHYPAFVSDKVEVRLGKFGAGIFAKEDIPPDVEILRLKHEEQITIETVFEAIQNYSMLSVNTMDSIDVLTLHLLLEIRKGIGSKIWKYLGTLPKVHTTVIEMWPVELEQFMTKAVHNVYSFNVNDTRERYERVCSIYDASSENNITFDEFRYAYITVYTRYKLNDCPEENLWPEWFDPTIDGGKCGALAPLFDMVNHMSDPNCDWGHESGVYITSTKHIIQDEELYINYGHDENLDLVSLYGFTFSDNPSPLKFTSLELIQACEVSSGMASSICVARIDYFISIFEELVVSTDCEISDDMVPYLVGHKVNNNADDEMFEKSRWILFMKYLLKKRMDEVKKKLYELRNAKVGDVYDNMLTDIYDSDKFLIRKCVSMYDSKLNFLQNRLFRLD